MSRGGRPRPPRARGRDQAPTAAGHPFQHRVVDPVPAARVLAAEAVDVPEDRDRPADVGHPFEQPQRALEAGGGREPQVALLGQGRIHHRQRQLDQAERPLLGQVVGPVREREPGPQADRVAVALARVVAEAEPVELGQGRVGVVAQVVEAHSRHRRAGQLLEPGPLLGDPLGPLRARVARVQADLVALRRDLGDDGRPQAGRTPPDRARRRGGGCPPSRNRSSGRRGRARWRRCARTTSSGRCRAGAGTARRRGPAPRRRHPVRWSRTAPRARAAAPTSARGRLQRQGVSTSWVSATVKGVRPVSPTATRNCCSRLSTAGRSGSASAAEAGKRPCSSRVAPARSSHRERCQNALATRSCPPSPKSTMPPSPSSAAALPDSK